MHNHKSDIRKLTDIMDIKKWQIIQDSLAEITGLAIITADYKGTPVTRHSGCQPFCRLVRADEELKLYCEKCDSRGGFEAMRIKKPYIYTCHYGIIDAAIPIVVNDSYLGAVLIGQVQLPTDVRADTGMDTDISTGTGSDPEADMDTDIMEPMCLLTNKRLIEKGTIEYGRQRHRLPTMTMERIQQVAMMLFHLCNYIVEEAVEKHTIMQMITDGGSKQETADAAENAALLPVDRLESIKKKLNNAIANAIIPTETFDEKISHHRILQPAFTFIDEHKSERCKLEEMAVLCHVSTSYFSKLFAKKTGKNYSDYLREKRIDWAKNLLSSTDLQISDIATDVGFSDASHFVKTFKAFEGITPARYRNMFLDEHENF
ncbi:MAG: PocR ligand-binding domain-containing protein [Clostridiales Family XIII bacterium]|jgi:ligand-binding sensor protein/AraC-like DNA-binding protein|nr:PocR ligand-binding domain-containing protein [Clostridiales Family XIII bacterium]